MSHLTCELEGASIVLLGDLNPAIFHPGWFAANNLLRKSEADDATIQVVTRELTAFNTSWLRLAVLPDRFTASCIGADGHELLRDLVVGTFTLLAHTPIRRFGFNRDQHFAAPDRDYIMRLGHKLAPKDVWPASLQLPLLFSMTMKATRADKASGNVHVQIAPSRNLPLGIFVQVNEDREVSSAAQVVDAVKNEFIEAMTFAGKVAQELVAQGDEK
jgi:hypothetical protein